MGVGRTVARVLALLAGLFLAANAGWMFFTASFNLGVAMEVVLSLACLAYAFVKKISGLVWVNVVAAAGLAGLAAAVSWLATTGMRDTATGNEDVLVVLGASVQGREVSPTFAARLDVAAEFHRHHPDAFIVVTGGQGPQEGVAEGIAGRDYLLARGVTADRVLVEDTSTSTAENFRFAAAVLAPHYRPNWKWAFVTNEFHVWRAGQIARQNGIDAASLHAGTMWHVRPSAYLRELAAIAQFLVTRTG